MKHLKKFLLLILIIPCAFMFSACSPFWDTTAYVVGIEKGSSIGTTQTYIVKYSDGTTSSFEVENGEDGEDYNLVDLFNLGVSMNIYTNDQAGFEKFIKSLNIENSTPTSISKATNKALMSVVKIYSHHYVTTRYSTGETNKDTITNTGAGVIYRMDDEFSYVITNYHVVYEEKSDTTNHIANTIYAYQYGVEENVYSQVNSLGGTVYDDNGYPKTVFAGDTLTCEYVGGEAVYDLAVIKIKTADLLRCNPNTRPVDVASSYSVTNTAIAIGNPEGYGLSVTQGIISVDSEEIHMNLNGYNDVLLRELRVDTAINSGNSGGGLFNDKGELIGIVNAKLSSTQSNSASIENMGYALPYEDVIAVVDNILDNYNISHSNKGIKTYNLGLTYTVNNSHTVYDSTTGEMRLENNLVVHSTTGTSQQLGLKNGDIIRSVYIQRKDAQEGETYTIERAYKLRNIVLSLRAGDKFIINFDRGDSLDNNTTISEVTASNISSLNTDNHIWNNSATYIYKV